MEERLTMDMRALQRQIWQWRKDNFGDPDDNTYAQQAMGIAEECGELQHAVLKEWQGIRLDQDHIREAKDACGDMIIYMMNLCSSRGWDLEDIIKTTALHVMSRKRKDQLTRSENNGKKG